MEIQHAGFPGIPEKSNGEKELGIWNLRQASRRDKRSLKANNWASVSLLGFRDQSLKRNEKDSNHKGIRGTERLLKQKERVRGTKWNPGY